MKFYLASSALVLLSSALTIISATEPPKLRGAIAVDNIKAIAYGEDYSSEDAPYDNDYNYNEPHDGGPGYTRGDYQDNPGYEHSAMGQPQEAAEFAAVSYGRRNHGHGGRHHHSQNYAPTPASSSSDAAAAAAYKRMQDEKNSDAAAAKAYALTQCCTVDWQLPYSSALCPSSNPKIRGPGVCCTTSMQFFNGDVNQLSACPAPVEKNSDAAAAAAFKRMQDEKKRKNAAATNQPMNWVGNCSGGTLNCDENGCKCNEASNQYQSNSYQNNKGYKHQATHYDYDGNQYQQPNSSYQNNPGYQHRASYGSGNRGNPTQCFNYSDPNTCANCGCTWNANMCHP